MLSAPGREALAEAEAEAEAAEATGARSPMPTKGGNGMAGDELSLALASPPTQVAEAEAAEAGKRML